MKNTIVTILTIVSLILGAALLVQHTQARKKLDTAEKQQQTVTEERNEARARVDEQGKVISQLETNLAEGKAELTAKTSELEKTAAELAKSQADFKTAQAEVQKQASRITDLESEKDRLTHRMDDLQGSIASLESKIADTKKKLDASEGDRQTLLAQLKKLETEKATLVAQFNTISAVRAQLAKLKEEAAIAQRLAWIRSGVYVNQEKKGAERLLAETAERKEKTDGRLNVEVEQNGGARVTSPKPVN